MAPCALIKALCLSTVPCLGSCGGNDPELVGSGTEAATNEASDIPEAQPEANKSQTDEGEDPSMLQLAWEVLEVARVIYERCVFFCTWPWFIR